MKRLLLIPALIIGRALIACAAEPETVVAGDLGRWKTVWHGVGNVSGSAHALPRAGAILARALDAAKDGNKPEFYACFLDVDVSRPTEKVAGWFEQWRLTSRQYIYMIVEEAVFAGAGEVSSSTLSVLSLAPCRPQVPKQVFPDTPKPSAQVIFARQVGTEWKLVTDAPDAKIAGHLLQRGSTMVYEPMPFVYRTPEEAKAAEKDRRLAMQARIIQTSRERGVEIGELNGMKERFAQENAGNPVRTWQDWTNTYRAKFLSPPVVFDASEPGPIDFSTPVAALRSFIRANVAGDAKTLLAYADESGRAFLRKVSKVDENNPKATYAVLPKLTRVTVLLTGATTFQGKDYTLLLYRVEESTNPKSGIVTFSTQIVRRQNNSFVISKDLDGSSPFESVRTVAGAYFMFLLPYPKFLARGKETSFPPHFYTID